MWLSGNYARKEGSALEYDIEVVGAEPISNIRFISKGLCNTKNIEYHENIACMLTCVEMSCESSTQDSLILRENGERVIGSDVSK